MNKITTPVLGEYRLTRDHRFRVGSSSFHMDAGAPVTIKQIDAGNRAVLINFADRDCDWYSDSLIGDLFEPVEQPEPTNDGLRFYSSDESDPEQSPIDSDTIRVVAPDGRTAFTIQLVDGQPSIKVSTWSTFRLDGVLYDRGITIEPVASNLVAITSKRFEA